MLISGKISTGMRKPAPMPVSAVNMSAANTVYGLLSAISTTDIDVMTDLFQALSLGRHHGKLGPGAGVQLLHDAADVVLHGSFRQIKRSSDLAVAPALGDEAQDLFLLLAQRLDDGCGGPRCRVIGQCAARYVVRSTRVVGG